MYNIIIDPECLKVNGEAVNDEVINQFIELLSDIMEMENFDFLLPLVPIETYNMDYLESLNIFNFASHLSGNDYTAKDFYTVMNYITKADTIDYSDQKNGYSFNSFSVKSVGDNKDQSQFIPENLAMNLILSNIFEGNTFLRSKLNNSFECSSEINDPIKNEVYKFDDVLKLLNTTKQILKEINIVYLWKNTHSIEEYERNIKLYFLLNNESKDMREWTIGNSFFDNFKKYGFHTESTKIKNLLKAMLFTVWTDEMNSKTHKLRTSKSGGSPQIVSQKGKGMRMDIDHEFHLHYWENQNKLEFASINTHNDFSIPD